MNKGFWSDIYKAAYLGTGKGEPITIFRLDAVEAPKSWPKISAKTIEEAVLLATQQYSRIHDEGGKTPKLGNPDIKPHNPTSLGSIFIPVPAD